jgi:hypothetical protein
VYTLPLSGGTPTVLTQSDLQALGLYEDVLRDNPSKRVWYTLRLDFADAHVRVKLGDAPGTYDVYVF